MGRMTIDARTHALLSQAKEPVELYDEAGRLLGRFTPLFDPSQYEYLTEPASDEEIARRLRANEPTYPSAEVRSCLCWTVWSWPPKRPPRS